MSLTDRAWKPPNRPPKNFKGNDHIMGFHKSRKGYPFSGAGHGKKKGGGDEFLMECGNCNIKSRRQYGDQIAMTRMIRTMSQNMAGSNSPPPIENVRWIRAGLSARRVYPSTIMATRPFQKLCSCHIGFSVKPMVAKIDPGESSIYCSI